MSVSYFTQIAPTFPWRSRKSSWINAKIAELKLRTAEVTLREPMFVLFSTQPSLFYRQNKQNNYCKCNLKRTGRKTSKNGCENSTNVRFTRRFLLDRIRTHVSALASGSESGGVFNFVKEQLSRLCFRDTFRRYDTGTITTNNTYSPVSLSAFY